MRLSPPGTHFIAESTEAMWIKCLAQGHDILMSGFELATSVFRHRHSKHMTNMLQFYTLYQYFHLSINFIFRSRYAKNEHIVQLTVICVQGSHNHLKEHITCKTSAQIDRKKVEVEVGNL